MIEIPIFTILDKPKLIKDMLTALDKGHSEFVKSVTSPQLKSLIDKYRSMQSGYRQNEGRFSHIE